MAKYSTKVSGSVAIPSRINGKRDAHGRWQSTALRVCRGCGKKMPREDFPRCGLTEACNPHHRAKCFACYTKQEAERREENRDRYRAYWKKYNSVHREKRNQKLREYWKRIRQRGFDALGGKCVHCGKTNPKILTFGHIKNDGNEHRRRMKYPGAVYLDWDKRGWPKDEVELQCYNYNLGGACS